MDVGKQQLDIDGAVPLAKKIEGSLQRLKAFLETSKQTPAELSLDKATQMIDRCAQFFPVMSSLGTSDAPNHSEVKNKLAELKDQISLFLKEEKWGDCIDFKALLDDLFKEKGQVHMSLQDSEICCLKFTIVEGRFGGSRLDSVAMFSKFWKRVQLSEKRQHLFYTTCNMKR